MRKNWIWGLVAFVGGIFGGAVYQDCTRPTHADKFVGTDISTSAFRMANSLERIANVLEKH